MHEFYSLTGFYDLPACTQENYNVIISHLPHSPLMKLVESCYAANFYAKFKKQYFLLNSPKIKLFLQRKCKIFERWGLRPQIPNLAAPPFRISGYAPVNIIVRY